MTRDCFSSSAVALILAVLVVAARGTGTGLLRATANGAAALEATEGIQTSASASDRNPGAGLKVQRAPTGLGKGILKMDWIGEDKGAEAKGLLSSGKDREKLMNQLAADNVLITEDEVDRWEAIQTCLTGVSVSETKVVVTDDVRGVDNPWQEWCNRELGSEKNGLPLTFGISGLKGDGVVGYKTRTIGHSTRNSKTSCSAKTCAECIEMMPWSKVMGDAHCFWNGITEELGACMSPQYLDGYAGVPAKKRRGADNGGRSAENMKFIKGLNPERRSRVVESEEHTALKTRILHTVSSIVPFHRTGSSDYSKGACKKQMQENEKNVQAGKTFNDWLGPNKVASSKEGDLEEPLPAELGKSRADGWTITKDDGRCSYDDSESTVKYTAPDPEREDVDWEMRPRAGEEFCSRKDAKVHGADMYVYKKGEEGSIEHQLEIDFPLDAKGNEMMKQGLKQKYTDWPFPDQFDSWIGPRREWVAKDTALLQDDALQAFLSNPWVPPPPEVKGESFI